MTEQEAAGRKGRVEPILERCTRCGAFADPGRGVGCWERGCAYGRPTEPPASLDVYDALDAAALAALAQDVVAHGWEERALDSWLTLVTAVAMRG